MYIVPWLKPHDYLLRSYCFTVLYACFSTNTEDSVYAVCAWCLSWPELFAARCSVSFIVISLRVDTLLLFCHVSSHRVLFPGMLRYFYITPAFVNFSTFQQLWLSDHNCTISVDTVFIDYSFDYKFHTDLVSLPQQILFSNAHAGRVTTYCYHEVFITL